MRGGACVSQNCRTKREKEEGIRSEKTLGSIHTSIKVKSKPNRQGEWGGGHNKPKSVSCVTCGVERGV